VEDRSSAQRQMINIQQLDVLPVADALITALQLAGPIIADEDQTRSHMDLWVRDRTLQSVEDALQSARSSFPSAVSFTTPSA
jgi:hypothetical protein